MSTASMAAASGPAALAGRASTPKRAIQSSAALAAGRPTGHSVSIGRSRAASRGLDVSCAASSETDAGMFGKLGRVFKEKMASDFDRVFSGTAKSREKLGVLDEILTYWNLDESDEVLEELEDVLLGADFGPLTADKILQELEEQIRGGKLKTSADIRGAIKAELVKLLKAGGSTDLNIVDSKPTVLLIVGVNGGGKTTTIGKLAHRFSKEAGAKVMLAAGDTFRAAAGEQLGVWAERTGSTLAPYKAKQRPDSVLYETVDLALTQGDVDVVICDTSGRLHTNYNLMEELAKCKRSISKRLDSAPHEVLLVLDGTTGLNMLRQAQEFNETVGITGLVLTKLDGSARGGAVVSVVDELGVPVKFVGVGEALEDLMSFDPESFVESLFPEAAPAAAE